ncbi:MAG: FAD-dependent oxidoreductase [Chloroflexi bacterium]|nr:FAD-dependent oxidoreductase [Chloroflexota bacterium]
MPNRVVVVGGGLSGCAAAVSAARAGARVTLLERMELLGGCGLLAGRVDQRYFPVREELRLMGGDDIFRLLDSCTLHEKVEFPWPKPGATKTIYDVTRLDPVLKKLMDEIGVEVRLQSRAKDVRMVGQRLQAVTLDDKSLVNGDVFLDCTGAVGPTGNCKRYGSGCVMCIMRCPSFGDRVSIVAKAGVKELKGKKPDGSIGPRGASFSLLKESMSPELRQEMEREGLVAVPLPQEMVDYKRTDNITASMNIDRGFAEHIVLVDTGAYAKSIATGYRTLSELRKLPGLERAIFATPYAATLGLYVSFMALSPRGAALNVPGIENLFVASEKLGISGIGEVIATGVVAGHNAARRAAGVAPLILPRTTMLGDFIGYVKERWNTEEGLKSRFHLLPGPYFTRAVESGLYTEDKSSIHLRMEQGGLLNILGPL